MSQPNKPVLDDAQLQAIADIKAKMRVGLDAAEKQQAKTYKDMAPVLPSQNTS